MISTRNDISQLRKPSGNRSAVASQCKTHELLASIRDTQSFPFIPVELWVLIQDTSKALSAVIDCEREWQVCLMTNGEVSIPTEISTELLNVTRDALTNQGAPICEYGIFVITCSDVNFQTILVCTLDAGLETVNAIASLRKEIQRALPSQTFKMFLATFDRDNDLSISVVNRSQQIINNELDGAFVMRRRVVQRDNIMKPYRIADLLRW